MDDEMIDRLTPILLKHDPQTKIGAAIVLVELFQAMREPTKKMKVAGVMTMPDYDPQLEDAEECWHQMIDAIIKDSE